MRIRCTTNGLPIVEQSPPPHELTDRVMVAVEEREVQVKSVRLADRLNESRTARWAACTAALLVGSLPLLFVAHATKLLE